MFFPIGWPRVLNISEADSICHINCNRDKTLFGILTSNSIAIWHCKPCVPLFFHKQSQQCIEKYGTNLLLGWRPDSTMLVLATNDGCLLFFAINIQLSDIKHPYQQKDSPVNSLKRDSAELFVNEALPSVSLKLEKYVWIDGGISCLVCIRDELMIATKTNHVIRQRWDGTQNRDYSLDLRRIPFSIDQQISTSAAPITSENTFITAIEYSPLVGGFAVVFNCGKAAFLTAQSLKFDPNQVQGVWARDINDATCVAVNHKYRLIALGRKNSQGHVMYVDETTGSLEISHNLTLSTKDFPGNPGSVCCLRWTPDSCAIALAWSSGGVAIWSTFGSLLLCTLKWDYGLNVDLLRGNPFHVIAMEWSAEGYQLWMLKDSQLVQPEKTYTNRSVVQWEFVKSPLTVNPCMSYNGHIYLQGEDRLYINLSHKIFSNKSRIHYSHGDYSDGLCHVLCGVKQWLIVQIPKAYTSHNWPIRFTAIDEEGQCIAIAGKTGLAYYSILSRKWKLFGNEYQERDFIVTGGLLWYREYLITSSYSILENEDEIRLYPRDFRLDNTHVKIVKMNSQILLLNILKNLLLVFCANSQIRIYDMALKREKGDTWIELIMVQTIDISSFCPHPVCVVSASLTSIRTEITDDRTHSETLLLNVSGKLLMVQRDFWLQNTDVLFTCAAPIILASCVENLWIPGESKKEKPHLTETIWLFCGSQGMRVWLPLFPNNNQNKTHTFMNKRIMLQFNLKIYPLSILFEDAILLGTENDTVLYSSDTSSPFILPFSILGLTSQVYLHQILRQLIHRNLGYQAWEIARSCSSLPYFSHSLELLLHEVLEEEATSKEPLPDAQLPSVVEFIKEFPGFWTRAIVQCARKTEIALWPYLFSIVGAPKMLLQNCLNNQELDTAASYLLILQNLEVSAISKQYATLLLDAALEQGKWELSRDLVRFLRAIDPKDIDLLKNSYLATSKKSTQTAFLSSQEDDLSLVLGTMQVSRNRSYSTTVTPKMQIEMLKGNTSLVPNTETMQKNLVERKKSVPTLSKTDKHENSDSSVEDFFIDVILQRHARRLLTAHRLFDLGCFAAQLDFHLVIWMARERDRAAKIEDYVLALKILHEQFDYPYPLVYPNDIEKLNLISTNASDMSVSFIDGVQRNLEIEHFDVDFHDSGYRSLLSVGLLPVNTTSISSISNPHITLNADMEKVSNVNVLNDTNSVISEISTSMWLDDTSTATETNAVWTLANSFEATQISSNFFNENETRAEVQLRYLLQLFLEAGCLEWASLIAVILRDPSSISRIIRAACSSVQSLDSIINLRDGLLNLLKWSCSDCLGYKQFLLSVREQIAILQQLIVDKQQFQLSCMQSQNQEILLGEHVASSTSPYIHSILNSQSHRISDCSTNTGLNKNEPSKSFPWTKVDKTSIESIKGANQESDSTCVVS